MLSPAHHPETMSTGPSCSFCGRWGRDCEPATCLGCGATQCHGNGGARGTCAVCHFGILPGWSGSDRACAYKGCSNRAAFRYVPRVGDVCSSCASRAKLARAGSPGRTGVRGSITLREYANRRLRSIPDYTRKSVRDLPVVEVPSSGA